MPNSKSLLALASACLFAVSSFCRAADGILSQAAATPAIGVNFSVKTDTGGEAQGLLVYYGKQAGHSVVALAQDTGSAHPTEDFQLYLEQMGGYRLALSIPVLPGRGFRCDETDGVLRVFLVSEYPKAPATPQATPTPVLSYDQPLLIIDLPELVKAFQ